jgi:HPt (histidine-containing phosphotransfer) domain-containing protein
MEDAAPVVETGPDHDGERAAELIEAIGEQGYRQLLDAFFADAGALLSDLARAMAESDSELEDRTLHSLKGSAANIGFVALSHLAESMRSRRLDASGPARIAAELSKLNHTFTSEAA